MSKINKISKIIGLVAAGIALVFVALALVFNFTYTGISSEKPFNVFIGFYSSLLSGTIGGMLFVYLIASIAVPSLFLLLALINLIVGLCKKKMLSSILSFFLLLATAVFASFGVILLKPTEIETYSFVSETLGLITFILDIVLSVAVLAFFVVNLISLFSKKPVVEQVITPVVDNKEHEVAVEVSEPVKEIVSTPMAREIVVPAPDKAAELVVEEQSISPAAEKEEALVTEEKQTEPAKPVVKKGPVKKEVKKFGKAEPKKAVSKLEVKKEEKPAQKPAAKKSVKAIAAKKPVTPKANDEIKETSASKKSSKAYHISQHPSGNWQVKASGSNKALKLFKTQAEAIAYAKIVAKNQDSSIRVHSMEGKIRKA